MTKNIKNKINNLKNKTKKKREKNIGMLQNLTQQQRDVICKISSNTYNTFEDKVEEIFKKNKIDVASTSFNLEKQVVSELKEAVNKKGIKPNQDFYSYINDRWITEYELTENQKYIIQVDDFRIVQDKVYRELIEIIENYISNSSTKKEKCIKNAYESFKGYNSNEQLEKLAKKTLDQLDNLRKEKTNIWETIGAFNKNELTSWGCPFVWSINPDDKNPKYYKCYLEPPQLTLIDIDVYFDDDTDREDDKKYKKNYRKNYFDYLNKLFTLCFGKNHGFNVKDVFDTEFEILNAMACELIKESDPDDYNVITKDEALKNFGFDWEKFCKAVGFKKVPDEFVTSNVNYLLCGTKLLLEKWDSEQWRTFWIYIYIRQQCRWNQEGAKIYYEFEGLFQRGQEREVDNYIRAIYPMGFCFNTFLTNEYISRYNNVQAINYVKTMAEDLKTVFIRIIRRNNWMQSKTKKKALLKLENFKLTVGSPELLREDPLLDYKSDDPWGNILKMAFWRHSQAILLVDKPVIDIPVIDWSQIPPKFIGTQAYVVNAAYTPTENGIYIPLGYIQKPFVDLDERGLEYNLSRIGFTIAHEMSHALDDWGSKYDETGKLNNWWTEKDRIEFEKIQKNVIKQYETYASYDGIEFDAEPSVGEDLADISGLFMCQEYLRDFQLKNQDILPVQDLSYKAFYIYFAVQSRQKISKRAILAQIKTNPHPLDKYRCNVPLSRSRIFRAIFNVKKGDKMWWNSLNSVWSD
jgi:endothelin-converting enzyme/putative endopeptidase